MVLFNSSVSLTEYYAFKYNAILLLEIYYAGCTIVKNIYVQHIHFCNWRNLSTISVAKWKLFFCRQYRYNNKIFTLTQCSNWTSGHLQYDFHTLMFELSTYWQHCLIHIEELVNTFKIKDLIRDNTFIWWVYLVNAVISRIQVTVVDIHSMPN